MAIAWAEEERKAMERNREHIPWLGDSRAELEEGCQETRCLLSERINDVLVVEAAPID
jgi:hypothetical protein